MDVPLLTADFREFLRLLNAVTASTADTPAFSAYYGNTVAGFLSSPPEEVFGRLALADPHASLDATQRQAWEEEIRVLRRAIDGLTGFLFLEFDVPRLGSRIDAALVTGPAVFVLEFKCGDKRFTTDAYNRCGTTGWTSRTSIRPATTPRPCLRTSSARQRWPAASPASGRPKSGV